MTEFTKLQIVTGLELLKIKLASLIIKPYFTQLRIANQVIVYRLCYGVKVCIKFTLQRKNNYCRKNIYVLEQMKEKSPD